MLFKISAIIESFNRDEEGATAIEYGLIAALVSVAAIAGFQAMGGSLDTIFGDVSTELSTAASSIGSGSGGTGGGSTTP